MIINNIQFENRIKLSYYLKNNEVVLLFDEENNFNKWYNIKSIISDDLKKIFLNTIRIIDKNKFKGIINFLEINNSKFDIDRFKKYLSFTNNNPKDRMSSQYFQLLYGDIYEKKLNEKKNNIKTTLDNLIRKYGEIEGNKKWEHYIKAQKKSSKRNLEYWNSKTDNIDLSKILLKKYQTSHRKKYISDKSEEEIKIFDNKNSNWRIEYWIDKGYSETDAKEIISQRKKEDSPLSLEYWHKRGFTLEESIVLKNEYWLKTSSNNNKYTSKESLNLFEPIIEILENINIIVYYGNIAKDKKEWFIYNDNKYYFYDLTIFHNNKKYIIEYNGERFHPNKDKLNETEWNGWKQLYHNKSADEIYQQDLDKIQIAKNNGFEVLVLWSSDNIEDNRNKIKTILSI